MPQFIPSSAIAMREIADEMILVPIKAGVGDLRSIFVLNEWGAAVWKRMAQGATAECLAASLHAAYDVTPEEAKLDVSSFLESLLSEGLVEISNPEADGCSS